MSFSNASEVLESLQHLPEVIRPEHIRVNIKGNSEFGGKILTAKERENIYHRTIVKCKYSII